MSITSAFNNAFSGLSASSRRAELISNNISNALTDGYARREVHMSSTVLNGIGGGVRIIDIARIENTALTSARREADASVSSSDTTSSFLSRIVDRLGTPGEPGALGVQFSELESSFIAASNDPSNDGRLNEVVANLAAISYSLNDHSVFVNELRREADAEIGKQVTLVNQTLEQLSDLNVKVTERSASGGSTAALLDRQGRLLDQLNSIIPTKVVARDHGQISVFTPRGGTLLDGFPTKFDFSEVPAMAHTMTLANGALSDLSANGHAASLSSGNRLYAGGSLEALFEIRDQVLPQINDELDGLALDLSLRFQDPSVDPTLVPSDPGLLTDAGAAVAVGNSLGLAGRINLNYALDPASGGGAWKIRSGLNAIAPNDIGENGILRAFQNAMEANRPPSAGMAASVAAGAVNFSEQFVSAVYLESTSGKDLLAFENVKSAELKAVELKAIGVDSDAELQNLIEVETAYSANARVMSVLDEMLSRLLEI